VQGSASSTEAFGKGFSAYAIGDAGLVTVGGKVEGDRIVCQGEDGFSAKLRITPEFLTAQLGDSLPAGTRVAIAGGAAGELNVKLRDFATPIDAPDVAQRIAATRAHLEVTLPAISYADAKTDLVGKPAVLSGTKLTVLMTPETRPLLRLESSIADTPPGTIDVEITALDPLENLTAEGAWKTYRTSSSVRLANVPTALADALAGQEMSRPAMATGTVKWFNDSKGFGFITQDGGGEDVFCHHTAIKAEGFRTLAEGQKVEFDVTKGPKGLQAANVRPL
jgi:CspA family cold shock protein